MGGNSFAVHCANNQSGHNPYLAFDNNESTYFSSYGCGQPPIYVYNPNPLNIQTIKIHVNSWVLGAYIISGSNDYTNWEHIYTHNCHYDTGSTNTFSIPENTKYFRYHQITCQTSSVDYWDVYSITLTGTILLGNNIQNYLWASPSESQYIIRAY